jgi:hypothetical protein
LHRCLQLDPAARPAAADFARHLHAAAASLNPAAEAAASRPWRRLGLAGAIAAGLVVGAAAVALWVQSQPEVRTAPVTPPAAAFSPTVAMRLELTPASTQIYIDGTPLTAPHVELERGPHRLIAIAPGHYGQLQTVQLNEATTIKIELQPTKLPSDAEFKRFLDLADAGRITAADRDSMTETTLRTALSTKLLREAANQDGLRAMEQDLQALAEAGDARAAVVLLLGPAIEAGRIAPATLDSRLLAAADGGDAMASFFTALSLRSRLQEATAGGAAASKELQTYCERLKQAAAQGWQAVAGDYLQRDGCR